MKKFSRIIESIDTDLISDIKDVFLEFQDMGFKIKITHSKGYYNIVLETPYSDSKKNDWMYCVKELTVADNRLGDLNLEYVDSRCIQLGSHSNETPNYSNIDFRYKLKGGNFNYDDIDSWDEFDLYCTNVLGKDIGYFDSYETDCYDEYGFGLYILSKKTTVDENVFYEGFIFEYNQDSDDTPEERKDKKEILISKYPKYRSFLEKYLDYGIDWDVVYKRSDKPKSYPIPFNKEGIEVYKTILEMIKNQH